MICQACLLEGLRSTVSVSGTIRYYDEEGREHCHDRNDYTTSYECSRGHTFRETARRRCWCETPARPTVTA